jgi:phage FluMu protein Com
MVILEQIRCPECNRRLVDLSGQAQIRCPKCKALVGIDTEARKVYIMKERQKNASSREVG